MKNHYWRNVATFVLLFETPASFFICFGFALLETVLTRLHLNCNFAIKQRTHARQWGERILLLRPLRNMQISMEKCKLKYIRRQLVENSFPCMRRRVATSSNPNDKQEGASRNSISSLFGPEKDFISTIKFPLIQEATSQGETPFQKRVQAFLGPNPFAQSTRKWCQRFDSTHVRPQRLYAQSLFICFSSASTRRVQQRRARVFSLTGLSSLGKWNLQIKCVHLFHKVTRHPHIRPSSLPSFVGYRQLICAHFTPLTPPLNSPPNLIKIRPSMRNQTTVVFSVNFIAWDRFLKLRKVTCVNRERAEESNLLGELYKLAPKLEKSPEIWPIWWTKLGRKKVQVGSVLGLGWSMD